MQVKVAALKVVLCVSVVITSFISNALRAEAQIIVNTVATCDLPGDLNRDGIVNLRDLLLVRTRQQLILVLQNYGRRCPATVPTVTPTPTATATVTPTQTSTATPTSTPVATLTSTPTATMTSTPTSTPTSTSTSTVTSTPTSTPTQVAQEVVLKDHITDNTCWNASSASVYHCNVPSEKDAITAASFTGGGGILKRVGAIFSDSDCNNFNAGLIQNMELYLAFYESVSVFQGDPFLQNQPQGSLSFRAQVAKLHTDTQDPKYYLNPVRITPSGTEQFYIESDVSSLNIQTTLGATHLVALWLGSPNTSDGESWIALSQGCPLQVGSEPDYYYSAKGNPVLGPNALQATGAASNFAAYFVSEMR